MKALGLDPKVIDVNDAKLRAMRQGLKEARERDAAATTKAKQVEIALAEGKRQYGPLVDLKLALAAGDFAAAKDLLEALAPQGTSYKQIAEGIARAAAGMSPSEALYRKKLREMEAENARKAEEAKAQEERTKTEQSAADTAKRNLEGAKRMLSKTPFESIPGAAEKLVELAAANWDPVKKGLKVPREQLVKELEKDPVIGGLLELKRLKAAGGRPPAQPKDEKPAAERRDGKGRFQPRTQRPERDKGQDEFAAALAEASRLEAAERRQTRKGR